MASKYAGLVQEELRDLSGNAMVGAVVKIYEVGTSTLAQIFNNPVEIATYTSGDLLVNDPTTGLPAASGLLQPGLDLAANYTFYADSDKQYDLKATWRGITYDYRVRPYVVKGIGAPAIADIPGLQAALDNRVTVLNVKASPYGAVGDGVADDQPALQAVLDAVPVGGAIVYLPPGTYKLGAQLTVAVDGTVIRGAGAGLTTLVCSATANYQNAIFAIGRSHIGFEDFTLDVNSVAREGILASVTTGLFCLSCVDSWAARCTVRDVIGSATPASGNAFAFAGTGTVRCRFESCVALAGGVAGKPADGFFVGGSECLIHDCVAIDCLDSAFVVESSNNSGISDSVARGCGCVAAISNALATDVTGNFMDNVSGYDWAAASGGINIGAIGAGDLMNTRVSDITIENGVGPAVHVWPASTGKVVGLTLANVRIKGATTQGFLINGEDILITAPHVEGAVSFPVMIQAGSDSVQILGGHITAVGTPGIYSDSTDKVSVTATRIDGTPTNGVYFAGTASECRTVMCDIVGASGILVGHDAGTNPEVTNAGFGGLIIGPTHPLKVIYEDASFPTYIRILAGLLFDGNLYHNGTAVGFNQTAPVGKRSLGAAATDAATTQTLANNLRQALIDLGLGQT